MPQKGIFWEGRNVLSLDQGVDHMGMQILLNSTHLTVYNFTSIYREKKMWHTPWKNGQVVLTLKM